MKNDRDNRRNKAEKVVLMDKYRRPSGAEETGAAEQSLTQLLDHIRRVRKAVPVNRRLQEELREKLLRRQPETTGGGSAGTSGRPNLQSSKPYAKRKIGGLFLLLLLAAAVLAVRFYPTPTPASLQPVDSPVAVVRFWNEDAGVSFTVSRTGDLLAARHGQLLLVRKPESRYRVLALPPNRRYHSPAFSPDGSKVALVQQKPGRSPQIAVVSTAKLLGGPAVSARDFEVLVEGGENVQFTHLAWSPSGTELAYTEITPQNTARVWVVGEKDNTPHLLTAGKHPTWSPDGASLIVQRPGPNGSSTLYLVDRENGAELLLGQGEQPAWSAGGHLVFVSIRPQERILTFMPDGSPQFSVQQRIGEIRSVYTGASGRELAERLGRDRNGLAASNLLASPGAESSNREIEWLRWLELQGVREPRVLRLETVVKYQNPVLDQQEDNLFFLRQDGATATILQVNLKKQAVAPVS
jgi:TolB protein